MTQTKTQMRTRYYLTPKEAASLLGFHTETIYRKIWEGKLKAVRFEGGKQGRWRIPITALPGGEKAVTS